MLQLLAALAGSFFSSPDAPSALRYDVATNVSLDVSFLLFTRSHPVEWQVMDNFTQTDFDPNRRTVMMVHGFTGNGTSGSVDVIRDAYLRKHDVNFISVDWQGLASPPYESAVANAKKTAEELASFVDSLVNEKGTSLQNIHLIGFSLGAQVAGLSANFLRSGKLSRITAIDPAKPMFDVVGPEERLDILDADLVTVLHSTGSLVSFTEPLGHIDFYPNNGTTPQPACTTGDNSPILCSHMIAPVYFAEAVAAPGTWVGRRCSTWTAFLDGACRKEQVALLGDAPNSERGSFYMRVGRSPPYGLGEEGSSPEVVHTPATTIRTTTKHPTTTAAVQNAATLWSSSVILIASFTLVTV